MILKRNLSIFSLFILLLSGCGYSQDYPPLNDGDTAELSLLNYNVSDPEGESVEYVYTLTPNTSAVISVTNIPGNAYFLVVQAHTYFRNVTLSYGPKPTYSTSVSGTNVGLWKAVSLPSAQFYLSYFGVVGNASLMLAVQAYGSLAPTPGGCNMEFSVEIAPYLVTRYTDATVTVEFAAAAPPPSVVAWLSFATNHTCVLKAEDHIMYRAYLPEQEFSPEMYFSALQRMMTIGRIKRVAHAVPRKTGGAPLRRVFAAYPGTGSAYVVVAQLVGDSAVYVPTFSYACGTTPEDDTCAVLNTTFSKFLCATILFLGLFACFAAHRFFHLETLLLGFLAGGLIFYTALINLSETSDVLTLSVAGGLTVGISLVLAWCCCAFPLLSVLLASTTLGYVVAAVVLIPLLDYVDLVSDLNYWLSYCSIMLMVPAILMSLAEKANLLATSVLGAYAAIIPIDYYAGSNLRFILLNSIRRATVPEFKWAIIDIPIQTKDIVLAVLWALLAVGGFLTQNVLIKNKPPFPAPSHLRLYRRLRGPLPPSERTPLITSAARA